MPQTLSAQFVCPSPKVLDFNEQRLHWASVVRDKKPGYLEVGHRTMAQILLSVKNWFGGKIKEIWSIWCFRLDDIGVKVVVCRRITSLQQEAATGEEGVGLVRCV